MAEELMESIREKVRRIMDNNLELKTTNAALESEITNLNAVVEEQKAVIEDCQEKIKMLKMAKSLDGSSGENKEVKLKINEMVREIDKCIALLNK